MKKLLFSLLTFVLMIGSSSAQKTEVYSDAEIIEKLSTIGELHNQGLDYVFQQLTIKYGKSYSGGFTENERAEMVDFIGDNSLKFSINNIHPTSSIQTAMENCKVNRQFQYSKLGLVDQVRNSKNAVLLSGSFFDMLKELENLVTDNARNSTKSEFDKLVKSGIAKLSIYNEKVYWVAAVNTAFSSLSYWDANYYGKWDLFFSKNITGTSFKIKPPNSIGVADIAGIITGGAGGAAYGAIGGSVVFPGVGTLVGGAALGAAGAITGGLGGSAAAAVNSFVNWLAGGD
jgi:hypothetical protein